jgi:hypothetical protein
MSNEDEVIASVTKREWADICLTSGMAIGLLCKAIDGELSDEDKNFARQVVKKLPETLQLGASTKH